MNKLIIAALVLGTAFTACNKGTISSKRLDGTWKLTSGTGTVKVEDSQTNGGTTTSYTSNSTQTWNGSTLVTVTTSNVPGSATTTTTGTFTSEWTFTKSDGKFTSKTKSENTYDWDGSYYSASDCNFSSMYTDGSRKVTNTTDVSASGLFTVLGSTGDIEKNTRILTETTSETTISSTAYTYFNGTTAITTPVYTYTSGGCTLAPTSMPSTTTTNNDVSTSGSVMTISESTKSEMTITSKNVSTDYDGTDKTVYTSENSLKFTKN